MSHAKRRYVLFGEKMDYLIQSLALENRWEIGGAVSEVAMRTGYAESTIYRWRQGRLCPPNDTLEILAHIGKEDANLDRRWGKSMLKSARHPTPIRLVNTIWGAKNIQPIPENLPRPAHTVFVGRQEEMRHLLELLSPDRAAHLISVDGIGGVGKTALVLEAAYRCLRASTGEIIDPMVPTFEAIIFASAKQHILTPHGILARHQSQTSLRAIFHEIAHTLDRQGITRTTPDTQLSRVLDALARQPTLLIIDNMETVRDKEDILAFLYEMPPSVKVVITTREKSLFSPIRLEQLPEKDGLQLINHEAREKGVVLSEGQTQQLYKSTGGVPAAIVYAIGQMAAEYSLERVIKQIASATGDVARFCFESSVRPLRGQPAHYLLMAMAMFSKRPRHEAVIHVSGLESDPIAAEDGMAQLQRLSLVSQRESRCNMLPLTREYALAELIAHPDFDREARERWVKWYMSFVKDHGGRDWEEFHIQYDRLEEEWENLLVVFDWCADQERYDTLIEFWRGKEGVADFTNIYGYWNDRLVWLDWLIQKAERRGDWPTVVEAISQKIWTLSMMSQSCHLEEADALAEIAWNLHDHADPRFQRRLTHNIGILRIRQGNYTNALRWLARCEALKNNKCHDKRENTRHQIADEYWRAVIHYRNKEYDRAEKIFQELIEFAKTIDWLRAVLYIQNWLADIAIVHDELSKAEKLLQTGLPVTERNNDKRRIAFFKRSFAYLEQARKNLIEARRWGRQALDGFDRLGMHPEANEMRQLLEELKVETD